MLARVSFAHAMRRCCDGRPRHSLGRTIMKVNLPNSSMSTINIALIVTALKRIVARRYRIRSTKLPQIGLLIFCKSYLLCFRRILLNGDMCPSRSFSVMKYFCPYQSIQVHARIRVASPWFIFYRAI